MEQNERITEMDAVLFALSFEVVLLQMRILEGSSELRLKDWKPTNNIEKLQFAKFVQDRDTIKDIFRRTLMEISEIGEWYTIKNAMNVLQQRDCDVKTLRLTNEELRESRAKLLLQLDIRRNQRTIELRDIDRQIAVLRDKISDTLLNTNTRVAYSEKWLYARFESLILRHDVPLPPKPRNDHEHRVHEELLRAYELQIKELNEALEYWRQRYDTDIVVITAKVKDKCEQLRFATGRREELQKLYNLHEGEMRSWLTFKRERAARLAREEHHRMSAIYIQAWWRGVMVRRALGQFKYLRQKKQPAKGKKK